jgi:SAM-dependent methyltransferase
LIKTLRRIRNRLAHLFSGRQGGLDFETDYWDSFFRTRGGQWTEDYQRRLDPGATLIPMHARLVDSIPGDDIGVLDVGAGPLTVLGKRHPTKRLRITAVDPLAARYDILLAKYGVTPPVRTIAGSGESLLAQFGEGAFDFVYAQNCIDHAEDPVVAIEQMVRVTRPGGLTALYHAPDEAEAQSYSGLHQWNFSLKDDRFVVSGRSRRTDIANHVAALGECSATLEVGWILAVIRRR